MRHRYRNLVGKREPRHQHQLSPKAAMVSCGLGVLVPARGAPALGHRPARMAAVPMGTGKGGTVEEAEVSWAGPALARQVIRM